MKKNAEAKVVLPPVTQVGIVVKDAEKTADYYTSTLGIGPFRFFDGGLEKCTLRGEPATGKVKVALAQVGPLEIELIQVIEGAEYYAEFLRNKGEGIHHLGINVDTFETYDSLLAELANQGIKPVFGARGHRSAFAYLDDQTTSGLKLELIHFEQGVSL